MLKRLAIGAGAVGLLLGTAAPALAHVWWWGWSVSNTNNATVTTGATASANTGYNAQNDTTGGLFNGGDARGNDDMYTGNATALAGAEATVNKNVTEFDAACGCYRRVRVTNNNTARVTTTAGASANTGYNAQNDTTGGLFNDGDASGSDYMQTGNAYANSYAGSWVNINRTRI